MSKEMDRLESLRLENIAIVLIEPQIPENIGAAARAMKNMGIHRLITVNPKNCDSARIRKMATGPSVDIVAEMEVHRELLDALGPFEYIIGTTARTGAHRPAMTSPRKMARSLITISQNNRIAILFGTEDRGLSNEHLRYCHSIATIPTAQFSSLNLAHAVLIICYELFIAGKKPASETHPRLANRFELEGMYDHLKEVFQKIGFINPQNPEHWMLHIRRFLSRVPLRAGDTRIIRGICRQLDWYSGQVVKRREQ